MEMEEGDAITDHDATARAIGSTYLRWSRVVIGFLGLVLIGYEFVAARQDADNATKLDASAIQIVQIWTPHLFYMIAIVGAVIAAYVITRAVSD